MAGIGGSWGSREELLHPRDKHGRFRKTFKMADNAINAITNFLDKFQPRTFQSDGQSAQYAFNKAKPSRFGGGQGYPRLHADLDETNEHLRAGDMDESTKKFVQMMDDSSTITTDPLILSQTVDASAFGLTPETLGNEEGGLEDLTGWVGKDIGYSANVIGTPMGHGPGKVTITKAVPRGTKVIIPARSPNDRAVFLDRDQELAITKVESDGRGGWYMMAVAVPKTGKGDHEPLAPGPRGVGLTPQQREQRVLGLQKAQGQRQLSKSDAQLQQEAIAQGNKQGLAQQPAQLPPAQGAPNAPQAPAAPGEPPPRNEPVVHPALGGPDLQGKGTAEIAQTPAAPAAPQAPEVPPTPAVPAPPTPDIRRAVQEAGIASPSQGSRRREWNNAYLGVASGKKDPADMVRELDKDIAVNSSLLDKHQKAGTLDSDPHLADDIKAQKQLADAISKEYGLPRRQEAPTPAPVKKAAPAVKKAAPAAPEPAPAPAPAKKAAPSKLTKDEQARDAALGSIDRLIKSMGNDEEANRPGFQGVVSPMEAIRAARADVESGNRHPRDFGRMLQTFNQNRKDSPFSNALADETISLEKKLDELGFAPAGPKLKPLKLAKKAVPSEAPAVNKAAVPAAPETGAPDIEKMTVPELKVLAKKELVPLGGLTRKAQIKEAILRNRESGSGGISTAGAEAVAGPGVLQRMSKEGQAAERAPAPTIAVRGGGAVDLRTGELVGGPAAKAVPEAPTPSSMEGRVRPGGQIPLGKIQKGDQVYVEQRDGKWHPTTRKTGSTIITVDERVPVSSKRGFRKTTNRSTIVGHDDQGNTIRVDGDESGYPGIQTFKAATGPTPKKAATPALPPIVNNPVAQKPIQAPDRREAFAEDWINTPAMAKITEKTAAGRSINEVRDDVLKGRITPDEGIRRLENDIEINKSDLAEVEQGLRGDNDLIPRMRLLEDRDKLRKAISDQENASSFMRKHFRQAPEVTPQEVQQQLDPETAKLIQEATPDQIRQDAKASGMDLKGDTKEELLQDLIKKAVAKEVASRAAKKAAPKKLAPAPLETKEAGKPGHVDARLIAEGLDMDESDSKMLAHIQDQLDGKVGALRSGRTMTPAAVGRELEDWADGPAGPAYKAAVITGVNSDNMTPELQREHDANMAQHARWKALADRLQKTRRPSAKKAAPEAPATKLTPEEKKTTKAAAELLDVPAEKLQAQVVAKRVAAKPPSPGAQASVDAMKAMGSRDEGQAFLKNRTKAELQEIAKASGMPYASKDTKATLTNRLVDREIGGRLEGEALRKLEGGSAREPTGPAVPGMKTLRPEDVLGGTNPLAEQGSNVKLTKANLADMTPAELANIEGRLGIKRTSLDRGDRIDAILAKQAGQVPERKAGPKPEGSPVRHRDAGNNRGGLVLRERPGADEPVHLPNGGGDQGLVHMDSGLGKLWQDLYMDDREPNSFVNEIAKIGERVGTGEISLNQALDLLRGMKGRAGDRAIEDRIQGTINDLEAPKARGLEIPQGVPEPVRKALMDLADIPTARRTGRIGASMTNHSVLDKKLKVVREISEGKIPRAMEAESLLRNRDLHESADGAFAMWDLFEKLFRPRLPNGEKNPDYEAVRQWIRTSRLKGME